MDVYEAILNRYSIRRYKSDDVPDNLIFKILEAARWAPSWSNKQCWEFIMIKDKTIITQLTKGSFGKFFNAPVYIIACGNPSKSGKREGIDYYIADVANAIQNLLLAARAEGLGTCWIGAISKEENIRQILGIPFPLRIIGIIPLGFPSEDLVSKIINFATNIIVQNRSRKELSEFCHMNKFGNHFPKAT